MSPERFDRPPSRAKFLTLMGLWGLLSYGFLSLFAPAPAALAILLYGKARVVPVCLGAALLVALLPPVANAPWALLMAVSCLLALLISEGVALGLHPGRILLLSGGGTVLLAVALASLAFLASGAGPAEWIRDAVAESTAAFKEQNAPRLAGGGPELAGLRDLLDDPDRIASEITRWSFSFLFVPVFLCLWTGLLLVLRNAHHWKGRLVHYRYTARDLMLFRLDERCVWILIAGLALYVGSVPLGLGAGLEALGGNALACLSVFYFFQGLSIYLDLLVFLGIHRLIRAALTALILLAAWKILVAVGVFDLWVNFRRFFRRRPPQDTQGGPS